MVGSSGRRAPANVARHRESEDPVDEAERSGFRRIWWCCLIRDRTVSLGMRRPLQITAAEYDPYPQMLTTEDMNDEILVYSYEIKAVGESSALQPHFLVLGRAEYHKPRYLQQLNLCQSELVAAIACIVDKVRQLIIEAVDKLPISVTAYTTTPYILLTINSRSDSREVERY
ncbi:hypothetical protein BDV10DRAFT_189570 [Aspergillus recurvatus]